VGYFELKLHKYILGTPETNITSCKKGHNRCPLILKCNWPMAKPRPLHSLRQTRHRRYGSCHSRRHFTGGNLWFLETERLYIILKSPKGHVV